MVGTTGRAARGAATRRGSRRCSQCDQWLPLEAFARDWRSDERHKRRYVCRTCGGKMSKRYRARMTEEQYQQVLAANRKRKQARAERDRRERMDMATRALTWLRSEGGLSVSEIARRSGLNPKTMYEMGERVPTRRTAERLFTLYVEMCYGNDGS